MSKARFWTFIFQMKIYENIEAERDRIQACINKFGWTSDHNLDWFSVSLNRLDGKPAFAEFEDGAGILFHNYPFNNNDSSLSPVTVF